MEGVLLSGSKRNKDFKNQRLALRSPTGLAQVPARHNSPLSTISLGVEMELG